MAKRKSKLIDYEHESDSSTDDESSLTNTDTDEHSKSWKNNTTSSSSSSTSSSSSSSTDSESDDETNSSKECDDDSEEEGEDQERSEDYCKGGYHVVNIGETFCSDRYVVIRKLGWGTFSTVWLCFDNAFNKYVAIKVLKSDDSCTDTAKQEIELLKTVISTDVSDPNSDRVIALFDHFTITGMNGKHLCMVFEVLGNNLLKMIIETHYSGLALSDVRTIIRQVLQGLHYLHQKCHIIHTDIKPENISLTIDHNKVTQMHRQMIQLIDHNQHNHHINQLPIDLRSNIPQVIQKRCDNYNRRKGIKIKDINNINEHNINSYYGLTGDQSSDATLQSITQQMNDLNTKTELSVKIVDLGNACYSNRKFSHTIQTRYYRSPEVILGSIYDTSADIWSTACMAFELATGNLLFDAHSSRCHSRNEHHLQLIVQLLGHFPQHCIKGKYCNRYFTDGHNQNHRKLKHVFRSIKHKSIATLLCDEYNWNLREAKDFSDFLTPMLAIDPKQRFTAYQCLHHPWLTNHQNLIDI